MYEQIQNYKTIEDILTCEIEYDFDDENNLPNTSPLDYI